ncbi:MAG: DNA polymerase Y family protein [Nitrospirales bacterium]
MTAPSAQRRPRRILFGDVDAMYASAAVAQDPSLAGKPVAVGGPAPSGIITAASYPARRFGVRSAMPTAQALRLCPQLVVIPPDFALYRRLHDVMRDVVAQSFPAVEWTSIDEFYADATDLQVLHPDSRALGQAVKDAIFDGSGLRATVAVATGKIVAKVAADAHKPDGLVVVPPGSESAFLAPRPVSALPGIGPKTTAALERLGVRLIGDLLDPRFAPGLRQVWGARLAAIQAVARGEDHDPVVPDRTPKSIGHETTFDRETDDLAVLEQTLHGFLGELAHDLRLQGLAAGAFTVKLKDTRFTMTTRQRHFSSPLNYDPPMWQDIRNALRELVKPGTRYRLAGIALSELAPTSESLFDHRTPKALAALDTLIEKHGAKVIRLGGLPER